MALIACGINHKTAPISIREQVYFTAERIIEPLRDLVQQTSVREAVILSTCHRTELYCEADQVDVLIDWLSSHFAFVKDALLNYTYFHQDMAAVRHIMCVASGLDSMIIGEPQILGQLKTAFATARAVGTIGPQLQRLFQYIFSTTKLVRSQTGIGSNPVSIAFAAVNLAKHIFADLSQVTAMVIGAGETIELAARYLQDNHVAQLMIVNRTYAKAAAIAHKYQAKAIALADLPTYLASADIVITATSSTLPILGKGSIERALKIRKRRPMFIVDLAVPRDVEPEVAKLSDVYLYCVDDLQKIIEASLNDRHEAASMAETIITLQAEHFIRWMQSLNCVATIRDYRDKIEGYRDEELAKALQLLNLGHPPATIIMEMARGLTNKIMHSPTVQMRHAGYEGQLEVLALARQLFELKD